MSVPENRQKFHALIAWDGDVRPARLAKLIEPAAAIVELAATTDEVLEQLSVQDYDVLVCALGLRGMPTVDLVKQIKVDYPATEILVVLPDGASGIPDMPDDAAFACISGESLLQDPSLVYRAAERRRLMEMQELYITTALIFACDDRNELARCIVETASDLMDATDASLMLPATEDELYIAHSNGVDPELVGSARIRIGERIAGQVARDRQPVLVSGRAIEDQRFRHVYPQIGRPATSSIVYPLVSNEQLLGVLTLNRRSERGHVFRDSDLARAALLASQVVLALEIQNLMRRVAAADKFAGVGQLASSIVHEINNPLSYVISNLSYIASSLRDLMGIVQDIGDGKGLGRLRRQLQAFGGTDMVQDLQAAVDDVHDGALRIQTVVKDLRSLTRPADDKRLEVFDLIDAVEAAVRLAGAPLRSVGERHVNVPRGLYVAGSVGALSQVFVNLFTNAAQAIIAANRGRNAAITVDARRDGSTIVVEVADTGPGIADEVLARIFEPFFSTKADDRGTGLGLCICRDIVTWHKGDIQVQSHVGRGTVFTLHLPAAEAREDERKKPANCIALQRPRVLCVDDEQAVCRTYVRGLRDCDVTTVTDGATALSLLSQDARFAVILCDVFMPRMTGTEFFERLRQESPQMARRLVFVTGSELSGAIPHLGDDAPQVVTKPINFIELRRVVHQVAGEVGDLG